MLQHSLTLTYELTGLKGLADADLAEKHMNFYCFVYYFSVPLTFALALLEIRQLKTKL